MGGWGSGRIMRKEFPNFSATFKQLIQKLTGLKEI